MEQHCYNKTFFFESIIQEEYFMNIFGIKCNPQLTPAINFQFIFCVNGLQKLPKNDRLEKNGIERVQCRVSKNFHKKTTNYFKSVMMGENKGNG